MIHTLIKYGANIKKYNYLKKYTKYNSYNLEIDLSIIEIHIYDNFNCIQYTDIKYLDWIFNYINKNTCIQLKYNDAFISNYDFIKALDKLLDSFEVDYRNTYIDIIKEELNYKYDFDICCPPDNIYIILYNVLPFINFTNIIFSWLISLEIKYIIINEIKKDILNFKKNIKNKIKNDYLNLTTSSYLQIIMERWNKKINIY